MASVSRTAQFAKVSKVLKKRYAPVSVNPDRPVLEHLLLACCLENAHYESADEAFAALVETFFDWNEIRVTAISELAEVMAVLPDPRAAANRVKRVLQSTFEEAYAFDLEEWRKKNLGPTVKWLRDMDGTTHFAVAYVVQSALGGHAIAVDSGTLAALRVVDLVSDKDVEAGVVPGLERAIAKSKGVEFGSQLHQLGADFTANPYAPALREILLEIDSGCEARLPKRRTRKKAKKDPPAKPSKEDVKKSSTAKSPKEKTRSKKSPATSPKKTGPKKTASKAKKTSSTAKKPAATKKKSASSKGKAGADTKTSRGGAKKTSASEGLSKRKPR